MELFTLIVINIVTAVALYILFSVRFSLSVEKIVEETRKNVVLKDLRENVEATVEYINTSLDLMDQKNRSFYQLVRRSEELLQKLEGYPGGFGPSTGGDSAGGDPDPAPGVEEPGSLTEQEFAALQAPLSDSPSAPIVPPRRRAPVNESPSPAERKEAPVDPDREEVMNGIEGGIESGIESGIDGNVAAERLRSERQAAAEDYEEREEDRQQERDRDTETSGTTLDRVLDAMGGDQLDISSDGGGSAEEMFRRGEQSARFARHFQTGAEEKKPDDSTESARRFAPARRPGGALKKELYPAAGNGFTMDEVGRPESAARDVTEGGLLSFIEGAGRTVRRMFGMNEMNTGPVPVAGDSGREAERDWRSPPREEVRENPFDALIRDKQERFAGTEGFPPSGANAPGARAATGALFGDDDAVSMEEGDRPASMTDFQRERAAEASKPDSIETPENEELRERIRNSTPAGRREIILQMVERGYSRQNIAALTGIGKAEVDLVATMPAPAARRRRFRNPES